MPVKDGATEETKVADEVWIATALLDQELPERNDFTIQEIRGRAERVAITGTPRPSVWGRPTPSSSPCASSVSTDLFITNADRLSAKVVDGVQFITSLGRAMKDDLSASLSHALRPCIIEGEPVEG